MIRWAAVIAGDITQIPPPPMLQVLHLLVSAPAWLIPDQQQFIHSSECIGLVRFALTCQATVSGYGSAALIYTAPNTSLHSVSLHSGSWVPLNQI